MNFDNLWWDTFIKKTHNLKKTSVFKKAMDKKVTEYLRTYVLQILIELSKLRTNEYGYRVYIDGVLIDNKGMNKIYDAPPLKNENLEQWTNRVFNDRKFGIIINAGEKFNLKLSKDIALKTKPLLERIGFPREGINFSIFIGNYDKTPLGIHKDPLGEDVMHFHLGPGNKTMYTWNKKAFEKLTKKGGFDRNDTESLIPYADEFPFEEGDIYFMPEGEYHIGKQEGLSIAVTFWRYNHTKEKLAKKLQNIVSNQFLQENDELLDTDTNDLNDLSGVDEILETFGIPKEMENMNFKNLMKEAYKELRYSLHSNAGYKTSPFPIKKEIKFNNNDKIQIETPFKILYKESLDKTKLHIYVRGVKIELKNFDCIKSFINEINKENPIKVIDLFGFLDKEWDEEIGLYILGLLYKNHGIIKLKQ